MVGNSFEKVNNDCESTPQRQADKILLADDDNIIIFSVKSMLISAGVEESNILIAKNGEEALDIWLYNMNDIAVVICDNDMPVDGESKSISGLDVLKEISKSKISPKFMCLHSANIDEDKKATTISYGAIPVNKGELPIIMDKIISSANINNAISSYSLNNN